MFFKCVKNRYMNDQTSRNNNQRNKYKLQRSKIPRPNLYSQNNSQYFIIIFYFAHSLYFTLIKYPTQSPTIACVVISDSLPKSFSDYSSTILCGLFLTFILGIEKANPRTKKTGITGFGARVVSRFNFQSDANSLCPSSDIRLALGIKQNTSSHSQ
jgi:hypothetical protein